MEKISLYGTVIPIALILLLGFIIIGGWKFLLLLAVIAVVGKLLSKFLSDAWVNPILFLLLIAGSHYFIQDIYVTMIVTFSAILVILAGNFIKNKKIENVLIFIVMISTGIIIEFSEDIFHKEVEISGEGLHRVEQEFEAANEAVENAIITIEEEDKRITLYFSTDRFESMDEVKEMGETFAEMVSIKVSETQEIEGPDKESYGELFQDYDLWIYADDKESGELKTGVKVTDSTEILW